MQTLAWSKPTGLKSTSRTVASPSTRRYSMVVFAKKATSRGPMGYVAEDNSGKANIFAVEPKKLYVSSPRADRAAQQGLGGTQGLLVVGGLIGAVLLITLGIAKSPDELTALQQGAGSLRDIAAQFS